jgi:oxygen-independent coproporphyrinogen-3 oxidase
MTAPVQRVHELIEKELPRRHSNRVMHAHPSPTLWLEQDVPLSDIVGSRATSATGRRRKLSVYVGTPYCLPTTPDRCGFCLFPSESLAQTLGGLCWTGGAGLE